MKPWTAKDVKWELVKAFRVLGTVPVKDRGTGTARGFWPEHFYEDEEIKEQQKAATTQNRRQQRRYSPREIRRMEAILLGEGGQLGWLQRFLSHEPGMQRCLARYAEWAAQDREIKRECIIKGWAYSTFRRKRDQAAEALANALNQAQVELP